jgi:hypothetical protein
LIQSQYCVTALRQALDVSVRTPFEAATGEVGDGGDGDEVMGCAEIAEAVFDGIAEDSGAEGFED